MKPTKLELKHLAAYLPYNVQIAYLLLDGQKSILDFEAANFFCSETEKLILRPLSDLFDAAEEASGLEYIDLLMHFAECDVEIEFVDALKYEGRFKAMIKYAPYTLMQKLFEFHFDVFGLIDAGLAIDKNTLETN
jgi:hypothetical protein